MRRIFNAGKKKNPNPAVATYIIPLTGANAISSTNANSVIPMNGNIIANNSYFDLSGLYQIQSDYINSIKGNTNLTDEQNANINDVQRRITLLNSKLGTSTTSTLYSQQKNMIDIIDREQRRLNLKKHKIDAAIDGKQRILDLNESYRARNADYIYLLAFFVLTLSVLLCLTQLIKLFAISDGLSDIIYIIILSIAFIYMYSKYVEIAGRDKLYYDKLNLKAPKILNADEIKEQTELNKENAQYSNVADLMGTINIGGCVGPLCCSGDTIWDANNSVCVKGSTFTTLENINELVQPNSPNEYINYSVYK
jgi:hypothetical protein